jgi:hypothetical protein
MTTGETLQPLPDMASARSMHCARVAFGQCRRTRNAFCWLAVRRLRLTLFHFLVLIREEHSVSSIYVQLLLCALNGTKHTCSVTHNNKTKTKLRGF